MIITFDDGSRSWTKRVMQALQQRGMVAEFYLTLDAIKADAIDWGDIRRLVAAGNGIGAHDVHHVQIAGLPGGHDPPAATMWKEINDIRFVILANVGVAPDSMAYVGGGYDKTLVGLVAGAGYTTARTINRGSSRRSTGGIACASCASEPTTTCSIPRNRHSSRDCRPSRPGCAASATSSGGTAGGSSRRWAASPSWSWPQASSRG